MQQPQPKLSNPHTSEDNQSRAGTTIPKLEAEIRQNRRQIAQLHQRNTRLTQKIEDLSRQNPRKPSSARSLFATPSTMTSRHRQPKRRQQSWGWLSISFMALGIAIICGAIGFAITRLIAVR